VRIGITVRIVVLLFCLVVAVPRLAWAGGAGPRGKFEARDVQAPVYSDDYQSVVGVLKIERIFTEQRRLGFFRVKLLPVQVAQGVCLELNQLACDTNWLNGLRFKPTPAARGARAEWRDVSVRMPGEPVPRLQAKRLYPNTDANPDFCLLEDLTLQTDAGPTQVAQARLLLTGEPGRVVWETKGRTMQWDLFTNKVNSKATRPSENSL
jgi:hypothetical protein